MSIQTSVNRYESLDILRGICALSIMVYHYFGWTLGHFPAQNVLGRIGIYGVSLFYVLSGLTMYLVYFKKFEFSISFAKNFYLKRFFRIFPLMWVVVLASYLVSGSPNSWKEQLEVVSGLFSIVNWSVPTPLGMWSIGNELAFYLMLPFIFWSFKKGKSSAIFVCSIILALYTYFAYFKFNPLLADVYEEDNYKNPFNQAGLFLGGILIGHFLKELSMKSIYALMLIIAGLLLFSFYPASGELRVTYIGNNRIAFTFICFLIAAGFFKLDTSKIISPAIKKVFLWLGETSYSIYLLHGLIWSIVVLSGIKIRYVLPMSFTATFIIAHLVYKLIEAPARNLGYCILKRDL